MRVKKVSMGRAKIKKYKGQRQQNRVVQKEVDSEIIQKGDDKRRKKKCDSCGRRPLEKHNMDGAETTFVQLKYIN